MLNGIARIVAVYDDKLKDDRFKEKLSRVSLKELVRSAKERRSGSLGFSEAILVEYNRKSHNPLPMQGLFSHRAPKIAEYEEEKTDSPEEIFWNDESEGVESNEIQLTLFGDHMLNGHLAEE